MGHSGKQTFSVVVQAMFQLKKPGGKMAWQMAGTGTSPTSLTLEEYQKNPQAYAKGLEEAAQMLATQVVGAY